MAPRFRAFHALAEALGGGFGHGRTDLECTRPQWDPAWWYAPDQADGTTTADAAHARQLCRLCPAQAECLQWAVGVEAVLGPQHVHGIAGGLDATERRPLVERAWKARKRGVA